MDGGNDAGPIISEPRDSGEVVLDSGLPWSWAPVAALISTPPSAGGVSGRLINVSPTAAYRAWAGGVLLMDGGVVAIPFNESTVLVIHPGDDTSTRWPLIGGAVPGGWMGGVLLPDGIVIGIPADASRFLRIDPATGTAVPFGDDLSDAGLAKFHGGVLGLNGQVYAAPVAATFIARLDPATGVVTRLPLPSGTPRGNTHGAVLFPTGDIVMFPNAGSPGILIVPSRDGGLDARWWLPVPPSTGSALFAGGGVVAGVDVALAAPQQNARPLEYGSGLLSWARPVDGLAPLSANNFYFSAWSTNGHAYALPYGEQLALQLGTDADAGVLLSLDAGVLSFSGVLGAVGLADGRIIGIPHGQSAWLEVTPADRHTVSMETVTSPFLNKL